MVIFAHFRLILDHFGSILGSEMFFRFKKFFLVQNVFSFKSGRSRKKQFEWKKQFWMENVFSEWKNILARKKQKLYFRTRCKTNRKWGILLKSGFHLEAKIAKNLIKPMGNGVFCPKERQAYGHPLASPRRGKKMGAGWRPWPGLAQAGLSGEKTMDSPKAGTHFSPRSGFHFLSPGKKWIHIYMCTPFFGRNIYNTNTVPANYNLHIRQLFPTAP